MSRTYLRGIACALLVVLIAVSTFFSAEAGNYSPSYYYAKETFSSKPSSPPDAGVLSSALLSELSNKAHPYILYESSDLAALRKKIGDGYSAKAYEYTRTTANKYLSASISVNASSSGIIGRQLQSYVAYLSVYGMLSGEESYMNKAASLVNTAVSQGSVEIYDSINGALAVSDFGYAYALAYDWLYDYMTDSERKLLKAEMEQIGSYIYTNSSALGTWGADTDNRKAWNWNAVTHGSLGMIAVALGTHNDWLTLSLERMMGYYTYAVDSTGAAMEGLHYVGYALNTLAPLDCVIKDYTGVELLDYYPNMQKLPAWSMNMTAPYGNEQTAIGQGTKLDNLAAIYYIINRYSQSVELWGFDRTYALDTNNRFTSDYQGNGWNVPAIIFYENKLLEKKAPDSSVPLINTYEKGQVVATDGWTKDSSLMTFTSGYGYQGCWNHPDNNTFTFFAKGESFVIDLGANFKKSSEHNVVIADGVGMRYEGGPAMVEGHILANKLLGNGALYVKGDNADAYNDSVLTESTRQIIYNGGDTPYIIAFDCAKRDSASHKYTTSFFTDTASTVEIISPGIAKITGGTGGAVAYAFVYSAEGASLSVATTSTTKAIVSENNAVAHSQVMLYITANPDGSMPGVDFSTNSKGNISVTVKHKSGGTLYTDSYTLSKTAEPSTSSKKAEPENTKYGTIPAEYANKTDYPFAVFKSDKTFVGAYSDWAIDGKASALNNSKDSGSVVLMRRDFSYTGSKYNNLSQTKTGIVIDLGGYTFTSTALSFLNAQKKTNNNTGITVKNGEILIGSQALLRLDTGDVSGGVQYNGKQGFDLSFDNVRIVLADNASTADCLCFNAFESSDPGMFCNLTFTDCRFDFSGATKNLTAFNISDSCCKVCVTVNGGEIISSTHRLDIISASVGNPESSLTFGAQAGKAVKLTIPKGAELPITSANSGKLVPKKISENANSVTYSFLPVADVIEGDFTPKASVTLDSNLIFNIYIPAHEGLGTVTLNGATVDLGEAEDGYYLITEELPANEAARELVLAVELTANGTPLKATFTFSTVKYAEKLLANAEISATEKTLIKDMLAYIASAYEYFNNGETVAEIVALLDGYVSGKVINVADAKCDTEGLSGATLVLGATPAIRFYLDGYNADKFSFKVGERALNVTEDNLGSDADGSYIEFTLFAYRMTETFSYEIEGTAISGEYNIISYYADAAAKSDTALADIVAKFYNYCESAYEYRQYVINNQ